MNPLTAFELLFFAVFGQTTYDELTIKPRAPNVAPYRPLWTDTLFKVVFGIYMLVSVVVLINLLIAMMSDTYQRIQVTRFLFFVFFQSKRIQSVLLICCFSRYSAKPPPTIWKARATTRTSKIQTTNPTGRRCFLNSFLAFTCWCLLLCWLIYSLLWWPIPINVYR